MLFDCFHFFFMEWGRACWAIVPAAVTSLYHIVDYSTEKTLQNYEKKESKTKK